MVVSPKQTNESNREYALRVIRENIISLDIVPGSMIGEQEIAEKLDISRTPVHEALLELSKSKIVDILPQKGCHVSMINSKLIEESVFIRMTIELAIIEHACAIATEQDIRILEENVKLQKFYVENFSTEKIMDLDNEFHRYLYEMTNKRQCYYMIQLMGIHFDRIRNLSLHTIKNLKIVDDHSAIFDAIAAHDAPKAKELLHKHLSRQQVDMQIIKKQYGEYFEV